MEKMKQIGLALAIAVFPALNGVFAQSSPGEIRGKIFEKKELPALALWVWVDLNDNSIKTQTDDEGRYTLKPLDPGTYIMHIGLEKDTINMEVVVNANEITKMRDLDLSSDEFKEHMMGEVEVITYVDPLIRVDQPTMDIIRAKDLAHSPAKRDIKQIMASMSSAIKITDNGDAYVRGSRADALIYFIDGVKLRENFKTPPSSAIASVAVYTGGVPAKYGDCLSGVIVVETKNYFSLYNEWKAKQNQ
jgi:hypothetical protein